MKGQDFRLFQLPFIMKDIAAQAGLTALNAKKTIKNNCLRLEARVLFHQWNNPAHKSHLALICSKFRLNGLLQQHISRPQALGQVLEALVPIGPTGHDAGLPGEAHVLLSEQVVADAAGVAGRLERQVRLHLHNQAV